MNLIRKEPTVVYDSLSGTMFYILHDELLSMDEARAKIVAWVSEYSRKHEISIDAVHRKFRPQLLFVVREDGRLELRSNID